MGFFYDEDSQYGQLVLELAGLVASLQDPNKIYTHHEVHETLTEISARALMIRKQNDRSSRYNRD